MIKPSGGPEKGRFSALAKKLRVADGQIVLVLDAPDGYVSLLTPGPDIRTEAAPGVAHDAVLLFVHDVEALRRRGAPAIHAVRPNGLLWVAYPKGGETVAATDLPATPRWVQRDVLGEITGEKGYKPVAFIALDETWTALRFKKV